MRTAQAQKNIGILRTTRKLKAYFSKTELPEEDEIEKNENGMAKDA